MAIGQILKIMDDTALMLRNGLLLWHAWGQWFLHMIWLAMDSWQNLDGYINILRH